MSGPDEVRAKQVSGSIGIAGAGRVAQALGRLLRERGEPVTAVASRDPAHAAAAARFVGGRAQPVTYAELPTRAGRILVAVSDDAITQVARILAENGMRQGIALHTGGALGPEALEPLAAAGVSCGVLHPLQTVATPEQGLAVLPDCAFAIDGDPPALTWAERIAGLLGGEILRIPPEKKVFYHAAAVMASNYVAGLTEAAVMLMGAAGVDEKTALRAIGPLLKASASNAVRLGPAAALTGPVQRGDIATVAAHLEALERAPQAVGDLYRAAGLQVLALARRRGLDEREAQQIERLLSGTAKDQDV